MNNKRERKSWDNAKQRCTNPNHHKYPLYGGRGIKMCAQWANSFAKFLSDMGPRPEGTTLDRIDNDGDYEPENCKWSTSKEQANNRGTSTSIAAFGETKSVLDWSTDSRCVVTYGTLYLRLFRFRWEPEESITKPSRTRRE